MKWYECVEDLCDGSTSTLRFRDLETANVWLAEKLSDGGDYVKWKAEVCPGLPAEPEYKKSSTYELYKSFSDKFCVPIRTE
jgi:hypothetical protein